MKVGLNGTAVLALAALAAVGVVGFVLWRHPEWLNPLSDKNLAYRGAGALVAGVTGGAAAGGEDSVGGVAARVREWLTGDDAAIQAMKRGAVKSAIAPEPDGVTGQGYVL